jgi:hypothetical protein
MSQEDSPPLFTDPHAGVIDAFVPIDGKPDAAGVFKAGRADLGAQAAASLTNQFVAFQFSGQRDGVSVLDSSKVEPAFDGKEDQPDVLVGLEMLAFHLGDGDDSKDVNDKTRATMRINFGKDESSADRRFDTVFWSIAAGLNLYNQAQKRPYKGDEGKDFKSDFQKAFGNRPIEIPGGLGRLSFEVVKQQEPSWWERIFGFLRSDTGQNLVSVLGFPALTNQAVKMLDDLLAKVFDKPAQPLFRSLPMRLALTKAARQAFTGGSPQVKLGALRPGFCVMARGRDFKALADSNFIFHSSYGLLVPRDVGDADLLGGNYDDPLKTITYVVFRVGMQPRKLDPTFSYGP